MNLLPVADAQARILAQAALLPVEQVGLVAAVGRWAAEDVLARRTQPEADLSAMDGYALRFAALPGPLRVVGEAAAGGAALPPLNRGEAARIFTGAPLPAGADCILVQEEAARNGDWVSLSGEGPAGVGASVRSAGNDFHQGDLLVVAGSVLGPARIALAAMGGHGTLAVRRRPRVALLATGDELVPPGTPSGLPASNSPMLAAMLTGMADVIDHGIVPDRLETLTAALIHAAADADILVTTGGASVGDHDLVRPALAAAGASLDFWRVAMKPGKPLMAGKLGNTLVIGLPGNPVSAHVTALLFLLPAVRHMAGAAEPFPPPATMTLAGLLPPTGPRAEYLRARLVAGQVQANNSQDSAAIRSLAGATHLIVRPPHSSAAKAGDSAEILAIA